MWRVTWVAGRMGGGRDGRGGRPGGWWPVTWVESHQISMRQTIRPEHRMTHGGGDGDGDDVRWW